MASGIATMTAVPRQFPRLRYARGEPTSSSIKGETPYLLGLPARPSLVSPLNVTLNIQKKICFTFKYTEVNELMTQFLTQCKKITFFLFFSCDVCYMYIFILINL